MRDEYKKVFENLDFFVIDYFLESDREWVLDVSQKYLRNPKRACNGWFIQFGETMTLLGKESAYRAEKNLHPLVTRSQFFRSCNHHRAKIPKDLRTRENYLQRKKRFRNQPLSSLATAIKREATL